MSVWRHKDLVSIQHLDADEIREVHAAARTFKDVIRREIKKVPALRGKTVVNLFVEPSTRTRISFELAAKRMSADVVAVHSETSSFRKGETLKDTVRNLEALKADFVVLRHKAAGAAQFIAERLGCSVVNAGDGAHEHPTQALLDTFTILEKRGRIEGLRVLIAGDILFSRVARSDIWALTKLGAKVVLCGPTTLLPDVFRDLGVEVSHDFDRELPRADVIYLLRVQHERQQHMMFPSIGEFVSLFGLTPERMERCKPDALIMHPGPINRGVEITSELADGPNSVILEQVTNGLAVRMAVLYLLNGGQAPETVAEGIA
ncbi:MAG: aspartate carbamoyltransferase catalytic subunit [Verrucomicrobiae bacterium]|nr:aspartate carbamoyltransferase catalytic subunit [Verrucomicrobiae bacterium]